MAEQNIRTYALVVDFHSDEEAYLAYFPTLPGCHTWAESYEGAMERAQEALIGYLEAVTAGGKALPPDDRPRHGASLGVKVEVPASL